MVTGDSQGLGIIKSIQGKIVVSDSQGDVRTLSAGDEIRSDYTIVSASANSQIILELADHSNLTIPIAQGTIGFDSLINSVFLTLRNDNEIEVSRPLTQAPKVIHRSTGSDDDSALTHGHNLATNYQYIDMNGTDSSIYTDFKTTSESEATFIPHPEDTNFILPTSINFSSEPEEPVTPTPEPSPEPPPPPEVLIPVDDVFNTAESATNAITGNLFTNDVYDSDTHLVLLSINGIPVSSSGTNIFTSPWGGTLTINEQGDFSYQVPDHVYNLNGEPVTDSFLYEVSDGYGGPTKTAHLEFNIHDMGPTGVDDEGGNVVEGSSQVLTGNVLSNDPTGPDAGLIVTEIKYGSNFQFTATSGSVINLENGGQLIIQSNGDYSFIAPSHVPNVNGADLNMIFRYTIMDADGSTSSATLRFTLTDQGPQAINDASVVPEGGISITGNLLANDISGPDGGLTVKGFTFDNIFHAVDGSGTTGEILLSNGGKLIISSNGDYTYTSPTQVNNALGNVPVDFSYTITDADGSSASANFHIDITDTHPNAVNDVRSVQEGGAAISGNLLANDIHGADAVSVTGFTYDGGLQGTLGQLVTLASGATLIVNADGSYTYTPPAQVNNPAGADVPDSFLYTIQDADGSTSRATATMNITDTQPQAVDDVRTVQEGDAAVSGNLLANDIHSADAISVTGFTYDGGLQGTLGQLVTLASGATLIVNVDGSYTYTPPAHVNNPAGADVPDSFQYTIQDADGSTSSATATMNITDTQPQAVDDIRTVQEGGVAVSGNLLTNDVHGADAISVTGFTYDGGLQGTLGQLVTLASGATLIVNADGSYTYTPPAHVDNPAGADVPDSFQYIIQDADGSTSSATAMMNITDTQPQAVDDIRSVQEGGVAVSGNLLANDIHGADAISVTGFTYDGGLQGTLGQLVTLASGATLIVNADGSYTYTPPAHVDNPAGADVPDNFQYTIQDADGSTSSATATMNITDTQPQAVEDIRSVQEGDVAVSGNLLTNDVHGADAVSVMGFTYDGGLQGTLGQLVTLASGATLIVNADGSYTYTPPAHVDNPAGVEVPDSFQYTIQDADGSTSSATATMNITDTQPQAIDDIRIVQEGGSAVSGDLLANDIHGADAVSVTGFTYDGGLQGTLGQLVTLASGATLIVNADGSYIYTSPAHVNNPAGADVPDSFQYTIQDADGSTSSATATMNITDTQPQAVDDVRTVQEGSSAVSGDLLANDIHGADAVSVTGFTYDGGLQGTLGQLVTLASGATLIVNANGSYTYTPPAHVNNPAGVNVPDSFQYTIQDADGSTSSATATMNITDTQPIAVSDNTASIAEGAQVLHGNVLTNDTLQADAVTVTSFTYDGGITGTVGIAVTLASGATLLVNSDGSYVYTSPPQVTNVNGAAVLDSFNYTITDADGSTSSATETINITDTVPQAIDDDAGTVFEGEQLTGNLLANDQTSADAGIVVKGFTYNNVFHAVDLQTGTTGEITLDNGAKLIVSSNGDYTYTAPDHVDNTNGDVSDGFSYTIADADGSTSQGNVTLQITDQEGPFADNASASTAETSAYHGNLLDSVVASPDGGLHITNIHYNNVDYPITGGFVTIPLAIGGGTLVVNSDGTYTYNAPAVYNSEGESVEDSFIYTVADSDGSTSSATVTMSITDQGPIPLNPTVNAVETTPLTGNIFDGVTNSPDGGLSLTSVEYHGNYYFFFNGPTIIISPLVFGGGSLVINSNGSYTYTPPGITSPGGAIDSFSYTMEDADGSVASGTHTIDIADTHPDAISDNTATVAEGSVVYNGNVLANDIIRGDPVTVTGFTYTGTDGLVHNGTIGVAAALLGGATLVVNSNGSYVYTSPSSVTSASTITNTFGYTITDTDGSISSATETINITDTAPTAVNSNTATVAEGSVVLNGNVLANDTIRADAVTVTGFTYTGTDGLSHAGTIGLLANLLGGGTLIVNANGTYVYTSPASVTSATTITNSFNYIITDADGSTSSATETINITDTAPTAVADTRSVVEGSSAITGNLLSNDIVRVDAIAMNGFTYTGTDGLLHTGTFGITAALLGGATLIVNSDGSYIYTPPAQVNNPNNGATAVPDSFTYSIVDADGSISSATVTMNITDTAPTAVNSNTATVAEGSVVLNGNVLANDTIRADPVTVTSFTYTGTDGLSHTGTIGVLASLLGGGTLIVNANGTYVYTSPASVTSATTITNSFNYTITDADGSTSSATETINITDTAPTAISSNTATVAEGSVVLNGNVLANDTIRADAVTVTSFTYTGIDGLSHAGTIGVLAALLGGGTLIVNANGTYIYTSPASVTSATTITNSFNYTITDADGSTSSATETINITDTAPTAVNSNTATVAEGSVVLNGNVLANDMIRADAVTVTSFTYTGTDGLSHAGTIGVLAALLGGGTLIVNANGAYVYTSPASVTSASPITNSFNYTITDADGSTSSATETINITDTAPTAVADTRSVVEGGSTITGNLITNDTIRADAVTLTGFTYTGTDGLLHNGTLGVTTTLQGGGTLVVNSNGSYSYTPPTSVSNVNGNPVANSFTYTITDADGSTSSATATMNVTDTVPTARADYDYAYESSTTPTTGNVLTGADSDTGLRHGNLLSDLNSNDVGLSISSLVSGAQTKTIADAVNNVVTVTSALGGVLAINFVTGAYTYTMTNSVNNIPSNPTDVFQYTVKDADGSTSSTSLTFEILPNNTIGDRVWLDANFNGVQDAGETGIAGIQVKLWDNATNTVIATTTTNASGNYQFSELAPGQYVVEVVPTSNYYFTKAAQGGNTATDSDITQLSAGKTGVITLANNSNITNVDAGLIAMPPQNQLDLLYDTSNTSFTGRDLMLSFVDVAQPWNSIFQPFTLQYSGAEGAMSFATDFAIDPARVYNVALSFLAGGTSTLEGFIIEFASVRGGATTTGLNEAITTDPRYGDASSWTHPTGSVILQDGSSSTVYAGTATIVPGTTYYSQGWATQDFTNSVNGTGGADTLTDTTPTTVSYLYGSGGNDTITGSAGAEFINGGLGADRLVGGAGNDVLFYDVSDIATVGGVDKGIHGGSGVDILVIGGTTSVDFTSASHSNINLLSGIEVIDMTGYAISGGNPAINASNLIDPGINTIALNAAVLNQLSDLTYSGLQSLDPTTFNSISTVPGVDATDKVMFINGNVGDTVNLTGGGWSNIGAISTYAGNGYNVYLNGSSIAFVDNDINHVNLS